MKTDELIAALATNAGAAPRAVVARRLAPAVLAGLVVSVIASLGIAGLADDGSASGRALWIKLAYATALAASGAWLTGRLARPAARADIALRAVVCVVMVMAALGIASLIASDPATRWTAALGHSWLLCPWAVFALSVPALGAALWALRGLAPTRPRAAGAAAGLLAGALGAAGYALGCNENATSFIAIWYTLGIAASAGLGASLGPRVLRW